MGLWMNKCLRVFAFLLLWVSLTTAQPLYLSDFQLFLNTNEKGGGPFPGGHRFFSDEDIFEGSVFINDDLYINNYGCPEFYGDVQAVGDINLGGCDSSIFFAGVNAGANHFFLPDSEMLDDLKSEASFEFIADSMVNRIGLTDTLIMTELTFSPGGFNVQQWTYQVPPVLNDDSEFNDFKYYHNHGDYSYETCDLDGFHHFDFAAPSDTTELLLNEFYSSDSGIIYIRGGQLRLSGVVDGQFTILTDHKTEYTRADSAAHIDYCYNNIWLMDDIVYSDADETGAVPEGSTNRLGLISGAHIIIANTPANGGKNSLFDSDIRINASLVAPYGSFVPQYWQNTTDYYYQPHYGDPELSKGDGRGPARMAAVFHPEPADFTTGVAEFRGVAYLYGSVFVNKSGSFLRRAPGPYNVPMGIGYEREFHYDFNLLSSPPPGYELLVHPRNHIAYGDVDLNGSVNVNDGLMILDYLVGDATLEGMSILNAEVSQDPSYEQFISALDASLILQYSEGLIDTLPVNGYELIGHAQAAIQILDAEIRESEQLSLPVTLYPGPNLYSLKMEVFFDPLYLEFDSVSWGPQFDIHRCSDLQEEGHLHLALASVSPVQDVAAMAELVFTVKTGLPGSETELTYTNLQLNEDDEGFGYPPTILQNVTSTDDLNQLPKIFEVTQNYPNPFNPVTTIRYSVPERSMITFRIYDVQGQLIKIFPEVQISPGHYELEWNGLADAGERVSSGIYFCRITTDVFQHTIKMTYLP